MTKIKRDYFKNKWWKGFNFGRGTWMATASQYQFPPTKTDYFFLVFLVVLSVLIGLAIRETNQKWNDLWSTYNEATDAPVEIIIWQSYQSFQSEVTARQVSAYNPVESQTDDTPCITASGSGYDVCQALKRGEKICGANFVPFGTKLYVENYGECEVQDRMNERYPDRIDIAMSDHAEAKRFGVQKLGVDIIR